MRKIFFTLGLVISLAVSAEVPIPGLDPGGMFFDSLESSGKLEFVLSQSKETLEFGKLHPAFGMALIFDSKNLPKNFSGSNKQPSVIQLSLGNRNPSTDQIVQFASLSIKTPVLPFKKDLEIPFQDMKEKNKESNDSAFLVINPSKMSKTSSDTEKLQGTFFSEQGKMKVSAKGQPKKISFKVDGKYLRFRQRMMTVTLETKLGSPFSDDKGELKGTIEIPFYWPAEPAADQWMKKIAQESLEIFPEISPTSQPKRVLASPKEKE